MSKYKQCGLFPIYKSDQPQDWQLEGYYNNWSQCIQYIPRDTLVSFKTPTVDGDTQIEIEGITIRKIRIKGSVKTILESTFYYGAFLQPKLTEDGTQTYYYFTQGLIANDESEYLDAGCLYELYIDDEIGNTFISNIFVAVDENELYIQTESGFNILTESGEEIKY